MHSDGSWECTSPVTFSGPHGRVQVAPGSRFYPGTKFMGFDIVEWLKRSLDNTRVQHCV